MKSSVKLTEGSIWKKIVAFAIPLFLGNLFQQLYNLADSFIVGNFLGKQELAAVTSIGSLVFLMVGFFTGTAAGAGVVISKYFGAKDDKGVERAVHTAIAFGLACGIIMTVLGYLLTPQILSWMKTPAEVYTSSKEYLQVYFCGSLALVLYNVCTGILQAVGDSKYPLFCLIVSSCTNVLLDLLFVGAMGKGVGYAALATTISQFLSVVLCFIRLTRTKDVYRLVLKNIRFDGLMLRQILKIGLPSGLQNSIISIANIFVQSNINSFGEDAMAGSGAYFKVEGFAFLPITCFAMAATTFISQNLGAKEYSRAKKGAVFSVICSISIAELVGVLIYIFIPQFIHMFAKDVNAETLFYGSTHAHVTCLFYFLLAFSHIAAAILRGAGKSTVPMFVMLGIWCVFRIGYIAVMTQFFSQYEAVISCYPVTWSMSTVVFTIYLLKSDWLHNWDRQQEKLKKKEN